MLAPQGGTRAHLPIRESLLPLLARRGLLVRPERRGRERGSGIQKPHYLLEELVEIYVGAPIDPLVRAPVLTPASLAHLVDMNRESSIGRGDP